jgi:hypothetical protein
MTTDEGPSYRIRSEIEAKIYQLGEVMHPDDVLDWLEVLVERIRDEIAEAQPDYGDKDD